MKQFTLFKANKESDEKYTKKIQVPLYKPRNTKPHVLELYDKEKHDKLVANIQNSDIPEEEKQFLIKASTRHIVFNYEKIADYYAHSSKEVQELMEESALVIIDFEKALVNGYVTLSEDIKKGYMEEYGEE